MKKIIIVVTTLIVCGVLSVIAFNSLNKNGEKSDDNNLAYNRVSSQKTVENTSKDIEKKIFSISDTNVMKIELGMKKDEVENILGDPIEVTKEFVGAFEADVLKYQYPFGVITLEPLDETEFTVGNIEINKPNYPGPCNIQVTDPVEKVLQQFPNNNGNVVNQYKEKMLYGKHEDANRGFITYDQKGNINRIAYYYGGEGFGAYALIFNIRENKVVSIYMSVMNI